MKPTDYTEAALFLGFCAAGFGLVWVVGALVRLEQVTPETWRIVPVGEWLRLLRRYGSGWRQRSDAKETRCERSES